MGNLPIRGVSYQDNIPTLTTNGGISKSEGQRRFICLNKRVGNDNIFVGYPWRQIVTFSFFDSGGKGWRESTNIQGYCLAPHIKQGVYQYIDAG